MLLLSYTNLNCIMWKEKYNHWDLGPKFRNSTQTAGGRYIYLLNALLLEKGSKIGRQTGKEGNGLQIFGTYKGKTPYKVFELYKQAFVKLVQPWMNL